MVKRRAMNCYSTDRRPDAYRETLSGVLPGNRMARASRQLK
jgi:hypothetical protein